jgi:hypothetical protein
MVHVIIAKRDASDMGFSLKCSPCIADGSYPPFRLYCDYSRGVGFVRITHDPDGGAADALVCKGSKPAACFTREVCHDMACSKGFF